MSSKKVLHVVECYDGGVRTAINKYIEVAPFCEHEILVINIRSRGAADVPDGIPLHCVSVGLGMFFWLVKYFYFGGYSYLHAHSSFAGIIVRIFPFLRKRIIYTPHCFAFEMTANPKWQRKIYYFIELFLSLNTGKFAPCGRGEAQLCDRFSSAERIVELNNSVGDLAAKVGDFPRNDRSVVMTGRLCEQKGVDYFLSIVRVLKDKDIRFIWVGGGDEKVEAELRQEGVEVTGWIPLEDVYSALASSMAYVHSAAWEGNPVSVIEAASLGLPVFARSIQAIDAYGADLTYKNVDELCAAVLLYLDEGNLGKGGELRDQVNRFNSLSALQKSLSDLYAQPNFKSEV